MISNATVIDLLTEQKAALAKGRTAQATAIADVLLTSLGSNGITNHKTPAAKAPAKAKTTPQAKPAASTAPKAPVAGVTADPTAGTLHIPTEAIEKLPKAVVLALAEGTPEASKVEKALSAHTIPTHEDRQAATAALLKAKGSTDGIDIPVDLLMNQPTDIVRQAAKALGRKAPTLFAKRSQRQRFTREDRTAIRNELLAAA